MGSCILIEYLSLACLSDFGLWPRLNFVVVIVIKMGSFVYNPTIRSGKLNIYRSCSLGAGLWLSWQEENTDCSRPRGSCIITSNIETAMLCRLQTQPCDSEWCTRYYTINLGVILNLVAAKY